jgi:cytochrome c peroxidase
MSAPWVRDRLAKFERISMLRRLMPSADWGETRRAAGWIALATLLAAAGAGCLGRGASDAFCDDSGCAFSRDEWARLQGLTNLGPPPHDDSNFVDGNPAAIELGRQFFADARFSGPATQIDALRRPAAVARAPKGQPTNLSCVSCHDLGRGGVDTASVPGNVSSGAGWSDVNALGIVNCAYQRLFTWNGRADSLWAQAFAVAENPTTMNGNRLRTAWVIANNYRAPYSALFGGLALPMPLLATSDPRFPPDGKPGAQMGCQGGDPTEPFGDAWDCMQQADRDAINRVLVNWAKVLAAYEATLTSRNAAFDVFMREGPASTAVSAAAKRGARLFVGKAACIDCHNTPLLSDRDFHNVGVPQIGPDVPTEADCPAGDNVCDCTTSPLGKPCLPWGARDGLARLQASKMLRSSAFSDDPTHTIADEVTRPLTAALEGAWRTPSLRNVALTGPYMHDGLYGTLQDVVAHYNRGGEANAPGTRAVQIRPLGLTTDEQSDLVAFLESLTESREPPADGGGSGAGGAAGQTGAGAASGGSGVPVSTVPAVCPGLPPQTPLITGSILSPAGEPYSFSGPGALATPLVTLLPAPNGALEGLQILWRGPGLDVASVGAYAGFGLGFRSPICVDARQFTGVSFTVNGDLGGCVLQFGVVPSQDNSVSNGPGGTCAAGNGCRLPLSRPIGTGTTVVRFSEMAGGYPLATADPSGLNGVQWLLSTPLPSVGMVACTANITVTDVAFVSDVPPPDAGLRDAGPRSDALPPRDAGTFDGSPPQSTSCPPPTFPCPINGVSCSFVVDGGPSLKVCESCVNNAWQSVPCPP